MKPLIQVRVKYYEFQVHYKNHSKLLGTQLWCHYSWKPLQAKTWSNTQFCACDIWKCGTFWTIEWISSLELQKFFSLWNKNWISIELKAFLYQFWLAVKKLSNWNRWLFGIGLVYTYQVLLNNNELPNISISHLFWNILKLNRVLVWH